ncbi:hypothetical protein RRG08_059793 [Elysia crispata]|uniref:Uncharacterized protein n=1 Tax=Elysia crispata TaxID=231223 RepID=A0AAE1BDF8_9GAST|nr:hypothetical protein RRG08_059793 [Elysia crispata]
MTLTCVPCYGVIYGRQQHSFSWPAGHLTFCFISLPDHWSKGHACSKVHRYWKGKQEVLELRRAKTNYSRQWAKAALHLCVLSSPSTGVTGYSALSPAVSTRMAAGWLAGVKDNHVPQWDKSVAWLLHKFMLGIALHVHYRAIVDAGRIIVPSRAASGRRDWARVLLVSLMAYGLFIDWTGRPRQLTQYASSRTRRENNNVAAQRVLQDCSTSISIGVGDS